MQLQSAATFKAQAAAAVEYMLLSFDPIPRGDTQAINGAAYRSYQNLDDQRSRDAVAALPGSGILRERALFQLLRVLEFFRPKLTYYRNLRLNSDGTAYISDGYFFNFKNSLTDRMGYGLDRGTLSMAMVSVRTASRALEIIRTARQSEIDYRHLWHGFDQSTYPTLSVDSYPPVL